MVKYAFRDWTLARLFYRLVVGLGKCTKSTLYTLVMIPVWYFTLFSYFWYCTFYTILFGHILIGYSWNCPLKYTFWLQSTYNNGLCCSSNVQQYNWAKQSATYLNENAAKSVGKGGAIIFSCGSNSINTTVCVSVLLSVPDFTP